MSCSLPAQNILNSSWSIKTQSLSEKWELDTAFHKGTFRIQSYKPIYVTAGRWSSNPNRQPATQNPELSAPDPTRLNAWEAKFQLSFKSKLWQGVFGKYGDLWAAFTQKAHWQVYNEKISRPFRELIYEPELILNFPVNYKLLGFDLQMIGVGLNHQSNGRSLPLSRSWNRIIFHAALERDHWEITFRPWIVFDESDDINPSIADYIGRGELTVAYSYKKQLIYLVGTHPLNGWKRGGLQLNYVFPVRGSLRLHLQAFTGYGETLIDYNHYQTTLGLGISFFDW